IKVRRSIFAVEAIVMSRKKPARELTTEEVLKRIFPKQVREELKKVAHEKDQKGPKNKGK
ncbi:MAG TPA: hypothetical protein VNA69_02695, partial [Thermoanaerobaculia bacterium]|nr:hypothetical protein [Thermoanaerobaculia bacterium]